MKDTLRWVLIIVGLLLAVGIATVVLPALLQGTDGESEALVETTNEPLTVALGGYLLGEELEQIAPLRDALEGREVDPLVMAGLVAGLLTAGVLVVGAAIAVPMVLLDRVTTRNRNREAYQQAVTTLEQREQEENKALAASRPPTPMPEHSHPRWDAFSTGFVILMFAAFAGVMVVQTLRPDLQVDFLGVLVPFAIPATLVIVLITGIILAFTLKPKRLAAVDDTDFQAVNWSVIWVLLSGLVLLGIGTGIMVGLRSLGG